MRRKPCGCVDSRIRPRTGRKAPRLTQMRFIAQSENGGSREGIKRECGARVSAFIRPSAQCRGCPRNCKRRARTRLKVTEGRKPLGRPVQAPTREPGDLPPAVVTCERVGRGAPMRRPAFGGQDSAGFRLQFAVTCHDTAREVHVPEPNLPATAVRRFDALPVQCFPGLRAISVPGPINLTR